MTSLPPLWDGHPPHSPQPRWSLPQLLLLHPLPPRWVRWRPVARPPPRLPLNPRSRLRPRSTPSCPCSMRRSRLCSHPPVLPPSMPPAAVVGLGSPTLVPRPASPILVPLVVKATSDPLAARQTLALPAASPTLGRLAWAATRPADSDSPTLVRQVWAATWEVAVSALVALEALLHLVPGDMVLALPASSRSRSSSCSCRAPRGRPPLVTTDGVALCRRFSHLRWTLLPPNGRQLSTPHPHSAVFCSAQRESMPIVCGKYARLFAVCRNEDILGGFVFGLSRAVMTEDLAVHWIHWGVLITPGTSRGLGGRHDPAPHGCTCCGRCCGKSVSSGESVAQVPKTAWLVMVTLSRRGAGQPLRRGWGPSRGSALGSRPRPQRRCIQLC